MQQMVTVLLHIKSLGVYPSLKLLKVSFRLFFFSNTNVFPNLFRWSKGNGATQNIILWELKKLFEASVIFKIFSSIYHYFILCSWYFGMGVSLFAIKNFNVTAVDLDIGLLSYV